MVTLRVKNDRVIELGANIKIEFLSSSSNNFIVFKLMSLKYRPQTTFL